MGASTTIPAPSSRRPTLRPGHPPGSGSWIQRQKRPELHNKLCSLSRLRASDVQHSQDSYVKASNQGPERPQRDRNDKSFSEGLQRRTSASAGHSAGFRRASGGPGRRGWLTPSIRKNGNLQRRGSAATEGGEPRYELVLASVAPLGGRRHERRTNARRLGVERAQGRLGHQRLDRDERWGDRNRRGGRLRDPLGRQRSPDQERRDQNEYRQAPHWQAATRSARGRLRPRPLFRIRPPNPWKCPISRDYYHFSPSKHKTEGPFSSPERPARKPGNPDPGSLPLLGLTPGRRTQLGRYPIDLPRERQLPRGETRSPRARAGSCHPVSTGCHRRNSRGGSGPR